MDPPEIKFKGCDLLIYWKKFKNNHVRSYTIAVKTEATGGKFHPFVHTFAKNISTEKSYLRVGIDKLIKRPFSLPQNTKICFKIGPTHHHLSPAICTRTHFKPTCFTKKALPLITLNNGITTITWNKVKGVALYSIITEERGYWR